MKAWQCWQGGILAAVCLGSSGCDPLPPVSGNHTVAVYCDVPVGTPSPCANEIAAASTINPRDPNPVPDVSASMTTGMSTGMAGSSSAPSVNGGATAAAATGAAGTSGAAGTAPSGTAGGSGQTGAAAKSGAGGGGALAAGELKCPNEVCAALPVQTPDQMAMAAAMGVSFMIENCCATGGDCGTSLNGAACTRTPDADPQCPSIDAMGFTLVSCCTTDGQCGIDGSAFMMGCSDLTTVATMTMGFITVPPPQTCKPK